MMEFSEMTVRYERLVYTICNRYVGDHHTAEDLMQETFLSAYGHMHSCPEGYEKAWLARIAANKAKDHLKSAYHRRVQCADGSFPEDANALFIREEGPEAAADTGELRTALTGAIAALKEPYRRVAMLYLIGGHSAAEIAQMLGRPPKTVHTQLYRAKKMLREHLAPYVEMSAAC